MRSFFGWLSLILFIAFFGFRFVIFATHQNKVDLMVDGNLVYSGPSWGFTYTHFNENGKLCEVEIQGPSYFDFANRAEYLSESVSFVNKQ